MDAERDPFTGQPHLPDLHVRLRTELSRIDEQLRALLDAMDRMQGLLDAVVAISREVELPAVLHRIVTTAMDLVGARYGALGVLNDTGEHLEEFITAGLSARERADLAETGLPTGRGVLGHLISHPEPLRIGNIPAHASSVGFPPGHPHMRTLLGVAISVRNEIYGDLYLSERRDGQPFDVQDENVVVALASAAGIAIVAAGQKSGPFAGHDLFTNMITLQAFNASASLTALLLGAAVGERAQTEREIAQACRQLAEMATRIATSDRRPALPARRNDQEAVSVESDTASE